MPEIITRKEALARGLKRYFTGKACKHGHLAERFVSQKLCCLCDKTNHQKYYEKIRPKRNCKICGTELRGSGKTDFCSHHCYLVSLRSKRIPVCCVCNQVFKTDDVRRITCSVECRIQHLKIRQKKKYQRLLPTSRDKWKQKAKARWAAKSAAERHAISKANYERNLATFARHNELRAALIRILLPPRKPKKPWKKTNQDQSLWRLANRERLREAAKQRQRLYQKMIEEFRAMEEQIR